MFREPGFAVVLEEIFGVLRILEEEKPP